MVINQFIHCTSPPSLLDPLDEAVTLIIRTLVDCISGLFFMIQVREGPTHPSHPPVLQCL